MRCFRFCRRILFSFGFSFGFAAGFAAGLSMPILGFLGCALKYVAFGSSVAFCFSFGFSFNASSRGCFLASSKAVGCMSGFAAGFSGGFPDGLSEGLWMPILGFRVGVMLSLECF
jgi:hypothetical protein